MACQALRDRRHQRNNNPLHYANPEVKKGFRGVAHKLLTPKVADIEIVLAVRSDTVYSRPGRAMLTA